VPLTCSGVPFRVFEVDQRSLSKPAIHCCLGFLNNNCEANNSVVYQQANTYSDVETVNNGSMVNVNFNVVVKHHNTHHFHSSTHGTTAHEIAVATPSHIVSPPSSPNMTNIPPVSSFIKTSEAVLHPSSPLSHSSPSSPAYHQDAVYSRQRVPSESETRICLEQRRHASLPSIAAAAHENEQMVNYYHQRTRSASLTMDHCSLGSTSPNPSISPVHLNQQPCSPINMMNKQAVYNVKTEAPECMPAVQTNWEPAGIQHPVQFENQQTVAMYDDARRCSTDIADAACPPMSGHLIPKQEKPYPENQYGALPYTDATGTYTPSHHPIFPPHQLNFPSILEAPESDALAIHQQTMVSQHEMQHQALHSHNHPRSEISHPHRHHPYMAMSVPPPYAIAVNGTIPYRPRYSRRNNPELEKKRVHKCNHAGECAVACARCLALFYCHKAIVSSAQLAQLKAVLGLGVRDKR